MILTKMDERGIILKMLGELLLRRTPLHDSELLSRGSNRGASSASTATAHTRAHRHGEPVRTDQG
jgi:hypothetical protein